MATTMRRWALILVALGAICGVAVAQFLPGSAGTARADNCGAGAVIIVPGTNDPEAKGLVGIGQRYTGKGANNEDLNNQYSGDGAFSVRNVKYPATLWPIGSEGYNADVERGKDATRRAIAEYQRDCGTEKPVVVVGYSLGARVAGDVLSDLGNDRNKKVDLNNTPDNPDDDVEIDTARITGELYSDPRQEGPESGRGIELSLIGVIPGLTMTGPREGGFGDITVTSTCFEGDSICDLPDPLHDPIGALDGLLGYFTKHGYYPWHMFQDPQHSGAGIDCVTTGSTTSCMIPSESAFAGVVRQIATAVGYTGPIPDVVGMLPNLNNIFPHANLSDLQPLIRLVQDRLPQLPNLTYHAGGYLPDIFVFQDIAEGILQLDAVKFSRGTTALAKSLVSIVMIPVKGTIYWANRLRAAVGQHQSASVLPLLATADVVTANLTTGDLTTGPDQASSKTSGKSAFTRSMSALTRVDAEDSGDDATPTTTAAAEGAPSTPASGDEKSGDDDQPATPPAATTPSAPSDNPPTRGKSNRQRAPFKQPWTRGDDDDGSGAKPTWKAPFSGGGGTGRSSESGGQSDSSSTPSGADDDSNAGDDDSGGAPGSSGDGATGGDSGDNGTGSSE